MGMIFDDFLEMQSRVPENIAIVYNGKRITNRELYEKALKVAAFIKNKDIERNSVIGIIGQKTDLSIAAILGVLFAGMTYLPIDSSYPESRIKYIIDNSKVKMLLSIEFSEKLWSQNQFDISDVLKTFLPNSSVICKSSADLPCYVIYTSGSSANQPNGVMISHNSILNTVNWRKNYYSLSPDDKILLFSSLSFDSSVEDVFCALSSGATLVIADDFKKIDPRYISMLIKECQVTHMMLVPSVYSFFLQHIAKEVLENLSVVILAGEDFPKSLIDLHYNKVPDVKLYNEYGPTENAVCSTCAYLKKGDDVNIGTPISNVQVFLLNNGKISECFGELCLAGKGLSLGYINNKRLTQEKFVEWEGPEYKCVYLTGDYVQLIDGKLVYKGRVDQLIKRNGVRVNLNEIKDICKKKFESITDIYVLGYDEYNNKIALFYTTTDGHSINEDAIKTYIFSKLPRYLVPSYICCLREMPLLPNYKVDYSRLKKLCPQN